MQNQTKKSSRLYILLLVGPIPFLILTVVIFVLLGSIFGDSSNAVISEGRTLEIERNPIETGIRFLLSIAAFAAVIAMILFPLWIIKLISISKHNKRIDAAMQQQNTLHAAEQYQQNNYVQNYGAQAQPQAASYAPPQYQGQVQQGVPAGQQQAPQIPHQQQGYDASSRRGEL